MKQRKPVNEINTLLEINQVMDKMKIDRFDNLTKDLDENMKYKVELWSKWRYLCGLEQGHENGRVDIQNQLKSILNV